MPELRVYRDASCGCCGAWVKRMEVEGFSAAVITIDDLPRKKVELGLPASLWSCHSATVGGYVLEGHVPPSSVKRLLSERPNVRGIAVPNMPIGSPGMEMGGRKETYAVMIFAEGANLSNDFRNWTGDDTRNWTLERHSVFSVTAGAGFVLSRPARRFSRSR
ncbi:DUF411 domain-containing protein [Azospirillum argentinense]|uniref:DUF411 domain-containing protein n=1 Tax=Azospirillum argentinense TaxID=2970906 RepID=A0A5B0KPK4_9PROT|nr:DUF411 domain-containing protein [Azospirillum argentinense]KAA1053831.1 DUF1643 domain-containing protein [Azospirillum argentinense]